MPSRKRKISESSQNSNRSTRSRSNAGSNQSTPVQSPRGNRDACTPAEVGYELARNARRNIDRNPIEIPSLADLLQENGMFNQAGSPLLASTPATNLMNGVAPIPPRHLTRQRPPISYSPTQGRYLGKDMISAAGGGSKMRSPISRSPLYNGVLHLTPENSITILTPLLSFGLPMTSPASPSVFANIFDNENTGLVSNEDDGYVSPVISSLFSLDDTDSSSDETLPFDLTDFSSDDGNTESSNSDDECNHSFGI